MPPSVLDPAEPPPYRDQPAGEFARGIFRYEQRLGEPRAAVRLARRMAFFQTMGSVWSPVHLSIPELGQAAYLSSPAAWGSAAALDPSARHAPIGAGEAECAAVARVWKMWTDDAAIVDLAGILFPAFPVERISDLLARAVADG